MLLLGLIISGARHNVEVVRLIQSGYKYFQYMYMDISGRFTLKVYAELSSKQPLLLKLDITKVGRGPSKKN